MKLLYLRFFIFLFISLPFGESRRGAALAQTYPIQLTTQLVPPYSGYLPDYATPGNEKLHAILLLKDLSKPIYAVRLTVKIEGQGFTMQTKSYFKSPAINIEPGTPVEVSQDVLAQLLDSKNLDFIGINKNDYEQRRVLPEGYYKICFIAYDNFNPVTIQVSNESCASAWMTLSDPPQLNLPLCGSTVNTSTPQQLMFNWTPMNQGSPNSAQNTEYVFELWEIRPDGAAANNIVQTLPPVYTLTSDFTTLNYGITETPLTPGMEYAWRVRAKDKNGYDNFKNKGYSIICTFRYGSKYEGLGDALKLNLQAFPITSRMAKLIWDSVAVYNRYAVNFRKQGWLDWFETSSTNSTTKVYDLEPETTYEARVQGTTAEDYTGPWSNTVTFKTPAIATYACGDTPANTTQQNTKPLPAAFPGMILQVGQFEMLVTQIQGSNGYYNGLGRISVPFLLTTLNVAYTNIFVNEDRQVIMGQVRALSDGVDKWMQDKAIQAAEDIATYIEGTIDSVVVKNGKVCTYANGNKAAIECVDIPKPGDALVIRDGDGSQYTITPDGNVVKSNFLKTSADLLDASDSLKVEFKASPAQQYGFDEKQYAAWAAEYEAIKLKNNKTYFVPYKGIAEGGSDEVLAIVTINNPEPSKLIFKTAGGQEISSSEINSGSGSKQYKVTVPADAQSVYAFYNNKKIGKLNVISLKPLARKVVIVPVNGASVSTDIEKNLNTIFKQANVSWNVSTAKNFDFSYDANNNGLDVADASLMTKYSPEMRAIRDAYRKDSTYDKNAYYLFAVNNFSDNAVQGYMVRGRAVGFIASGASPTTIAHELGHGAFGLEHTFPAIEKGKTSNLLDYGSGVELNRMQWGILHSRMPVLNWLDEEEDAASEFPTVDKLLVFTILKNIKNACIQNGSMSVASIPISRYRMYAIYNVYLAGIHYDYINVYRKSESDYPQVNSVRKTVLRPKGKITSREEQSYYAATGQSIPYSIIDVDSTLRIEVPGNRNEYMRSYLESPAGKNILLFVNGYRNNAPHPIAEYPNTNNSIYLGDIFDYWGGIAPDFIRRIGTKNAVYADGHHSITTSNHKTQDLFLYSMEKCAFHINALDRKPNLEGFNTRKTNGTQAGTRLYDMLKNSTIPCNKTSDGKITDTIDVVAHSMGFAYAQGMIEVLRAKGITVGRYYIIAPENACSGKVDLNSFEEVWQYGSNDIRDPVWEQDGVAPQCRVEGLPDFNRAYIPSGVIKSFLESHYISNYGWIFKITNPDEKGYVSKRK